VGVKEILVGALYAVKFGEEHPLKSDMVKSPLFKSHTGCHAVTADVSLKRDETKYLFPKALDTESHH